MISRINGLLVFDGPVYRGNSKKTIFTRGNSSSDISLPGKINGPAKSMMSAFTGFWENRKNPKYSNYGLLNQLWKRLYAEAMPNFISDATCTLDAKISETESYFDMRMGIAIDRDRMAQAEDQNFRLEAIYKGSQFKFSLSFDESRLNTNQKTKFAYLLEEMVQGRFWFGAQKSAGMGKCHLLLDEPSRKLVDKYKSQSQPNIVLNNAANYLFIHLQMTPDNPLLVSWPWGKKDEQGNRDSWIDALVKDTKDHQGIMNEVLSGRARNWNDVEKLPGGQKFESTHMKFGQPMDIQQISANFPKAVQNDDTLMNFLKGYRNKAHEEIDREPHKDFRESNGSSVRGKEYDQLFYRSLTWDKNKPAWEICIPGNTIKGAFRTKAQQILRTLHDGKGCKEKTGSHRNRFCDDRDCPVCGLFGQQGSIARVFCSDAYMKVDSRLLDDAQFSYDQIAIDAKTGKSIDASKLNFLYAYGKGFPFKCTLVLRDLDLHNIGQLGFLMHLLKEFENGSVPFGGKKTIGFGYIHGKIDKLEFLCPPSSPIETQLKQWHVNAAGSDQAWNRYELKGEDLWQNTGMTKDIQQGFSSLIGQIRVPDRPFKTSSNYISHRQYSRLCGSLMCEMEALTPLHVKESGEPSFKSDEVLGYDFFSISPPKNDKKQPMDKREYAIPPSTTKGMVRNIYNLISQTHCTDCASIDRLCDTCRLFGWVGKNVRQESALMGRLKFGFARPQGSLNFKWYGLDFGYKGEKSFSVSETRIFPHSIIANPSVSMHGSADIPEHLVKNKTMNRFALPGSRFGFQIDFTNLEEDELRKLIWALELENGLAHKVGKSKAVGFGSCKITISDAYLIDWKKRFSNLSDLGKTRLDLNAYKPNPSGLANYAELKKAMSALVIVSASGGINPNMSSSGIQNSGVRIQN